MSHIQYKSQQFYRVWVKFGKALLVVGVLFAVLLSFMVRVNAANVYDRYVRLSSSAPAATGVVYNVGFTMPSAQTLGSIVIEICANSPLYGVPCTAPNGFVWNPVLNTETGATGFNVDPSTTNNRMVLTRLPGPIPANQVQQFSFNNVINPYDEGTFYAKIFTYPTADASGSETDFGAMAMHIHQPYGVSAEVPPYLYFCSATVISSFDCQSATGSYINLGELSKTGTVTATSQMVAATNADYGFNITINGKTMTSGVNIIPGLSSPATAAPGTSRFGINLVGNSNPAAGSSVVGAGVATPAPGYDTQNVFKFVDGDTIATTPDVTLENKFTVTYMVNVNKDQKPGIYTTTLIYNILASF